MLPLRRASTLISAISRFKLSKAHSSSQIFSESSAYDGDGKTTVKILNSEESDINLVNAYSAHGFRLSNNVQIIGSIVVFPTHVFSWSVYRGKDITMESLGLFDVIVPRIRILVIGYGADFEPADSRIPLMLKKKGISCEFLPTPHAVTTYNYLVADSIHAAGAFVPVREDPGMNEKDLELIHSEARVESEVLSGMETRDPNSYYWELGKKIGGRDPKDKFD